jgi:hypothetical protein
MLYKKNLSIEKIIKLFNISIHFNLYYETKKKVFIINHLKLLDLKLYI